MNAVVVYESMYGNTHLVADAIGEGLAGLGDVQVVPVERATAELVRGADLVVVGGPTHAHGMSSTATRRSAVDALDKPGSDLVMDPDAAGPGLRDWFDTIDDAHVAKAAAFDTRIDMTPVLTGRASKGITRKLRHHGFDLVVDPMSFLVSKESHLTPGEVDRAREWGEQIAAGARVDEGATT